MIALKKIMNGGKKKRLTGIATKEEAQKAFDNYYKQRSYLAKVFDIQYQKDDKHTLKTCDKPEFLKCREKSPNIDGKGDTCLDVAERVCPKDTKGSARYTRTKTGPKRFDVKGVDSFKEGDKIKIPDTNKTVVSKGLPRTNSGIKYSNLNKKLYNNRIKKGEKHIVNSKPKRKSCKQYRKNKNKKCETVKNCKWVRGTGCRLEKSKNTIKEETKLIEEELEFSEDEELDDEDVENIICIEQEGLIDIKNINKIGKIGNEKICISLDDKIYIVLYNPKEGTAEVIGVLQPLIDIEDDLTDLDKLEDFIRDNNKVFQFIPKQQSGGSNTRILLNINSNGDLLNNGNIVGDFKNGELRFF